MKRCFTIILYLVFLCLLGHGQQKSLYELSLEQAISLSLENHQQLKVSQANIQHKEQQVEVSKLQQLPSFSLSANAYYLSDVTLLNTDFSKAGTADLPNFGNTFALQASQVLFAGGAIKKSIEMAELQTQLAELDLVRDEQNIKFLVTSNYLDICKLFNQRDVLEQNKLLVEQRLANITDLYEQDMVTRNELIRAELQIKNLEQSILVLRNNHAILSNRLSYALGLPSDVLIVPTENIDRKSVLSLPEYLEMAYEHHPSLRSAQQNVDIAQKGIDITKAELYPALSLFGGYNMQRPLTSSTPPMDLYNNTWQAGVSLSYNLDNLFKTKRKVRAGEFQKYTLEESKELSRQNVDMEVNAAYIKYQEAVQQAALMNESQRLANENYNIIEAKYLNQLAITAEMTDATAAKLDAELQYANAEVNVLFQYYNLLKTTGTL